MSKCPSCQTELADDFGLIDCPGCGAVIFVEMDGTVKAPDDGSAGASPAEVQEFEAPPEFDAPLEAQEYTEIESSASEGEAIADFISEPESPLDDSSDEFGPELSEPEVSDYLSAHEDPPVEIPPPIASSFSSEGDLSSLANNIDADGSPGGLRYKLIVQGIDTADLRKETRDALLDSKFGWDVDQLLKSIQGGRLEIKSISAVKIQIVIQRLKILPLTLSWEQYAD